MTVEQVAPGIWDGIVTYSTWGEQQKKKDPPATGDADFRFRHHGRHAAHHPEHLHRPQSTARTRDTWPNFNQAINVTRDSVDGCDITIPVYQWGETRLSAERDGHGRLQGRPRQSPTVASTPHPV